MEVTQARPSTEAATLVAASLQNVRFKERRLRDAQSDVRNQAVFFSPVIRIDHDTQTAVMQFRDGATGEVKREYPNPVKFDIYRHAAEAAPEQPAVHVEEKPEPEQEAPESVDEKA